MRGLGESGRRARRRASRGAASVEYGLLIAMIGAILCLGIGVAVKSVFQDTITCFLQQMHSSGSACPGGGAGGTDGDNNQDDPGNGDPNMSPSVTPGVKPSPSPSVTPSPTPSVTPTSTP